MSANLDAVRVSAPGSHLGLAIRRALTDGAGIVAILYVILFALYALWDRSALTTSGVTNLSNNAAPLAIAAAGESLVVISKGFDLSVAGVVSLMRLHRRAQCDRSDLAEYSALHHDDGERHHRCVRRPWLHERNPARRRA